MAHIDLRAQVRAQHDADQRGYRAATLATTLMHLDADEAEDRGEHYTADLTRRAADADQAQANRTYRPRSN